MAESFKLFLVPGSVQFLAVGLVLGVGLLYGGPRLQRWGRRWLTGLLPFYLLLCTPVGADVVSAPLAWRYPPVGTTEQVAGIEHRRRDHDGKLGLQGARPRGGRDGQVHLVQRARNRPRLSADGVADGDRRRRDGRRRSPALGGVRRDGGRAGASGRAPRPAPSRDEVAQHAGAGGQHGGAAQEARNASGSSWSPTRSTCRGPWPRSGPRAWTRSSPSSPRATTPPGLLHRLRPTLGAFLQSDRACYELLRHRVLLDPRTAGAGRPVAATPVGVEPSCRSAGRRVRTGRESDGLR
ncbi:MAG: hypothetical protein MZV65_01180 [Chromatiales bacterium]|nr:hypothetical protein [Chromatiales bacterium]